MNTPEKEEATIKRREEQLKVAEFYKAELELIKPYRDYIECKVQIMKLNMMHDTMVQEREDFDALHKKEKAG